jgi:hypothetical protein
VSSLSKYDESEVRCADESDPETVLPGTEPDAAEILTTHVLPREVHGATHRDLRA